MDVLVTPTPNLQGEIQALSSKNYTTRYLLVAALAEGTSTIYYPAHSEDSDAMRRCIRDLGAVIDEDDEKITITGFGRHPKDVQELDVGNAGAVLRFLMAIAALCPEVTFINRYPDSLGKRPHDDLIESLGQIGVQVEHNKGRLPITIRGGQPRGGKITIFISHRNVNKRRRFAAKRAGIATSIFSTDTLAKMPRVPSKLGKTRKSIRSDSGDSCQRVPLPLP